MPPAVEMALERLRRAAGRRQAQEYGPDMHDLTAAYESLLSADALLQQAAASGPAPPQLPLLWSADAADRNPLLFKVGTTASGDHSWACLPATCACSFSATPCRVLCS